MDQKQHWATLIALPVLVLATVLEFYALWGALFLYWGGLSIRSGQVFLVEPIHRATSPVLFWLIAAMWIGFGLMYVYYSLPVY